MESKKPKADVSASIDFSMFDNTDVANLILQRSEIGPVGPQIRDWLNGNDTTLLKYAQDNRESILSKVFAIANRECEIFLDATDTIGPKRTADIGCGYAFADLILYQRYRSELVLIDIEESNERHFGFADSGAGYANLAKAKSFLEKNGVPSEKITILNPKAEKVSGIGKVDFAVSLASCGFYYPTTTYQDFFQNQINAGGGIVLDIRKGSGGISIMKSFGNVKVLAKHAKYSTILTLKGTAND